MFRINDLEGTLMYYDNPLVEFTILRGEVKKLEIISRKGLPYEFRLCSGNYTALLYFLEDRVVPETRIGLAPYLERAGIPYYDPAMILKFNHACSINDPWWVRLKGEQLNYEQTRLEIKRGWGVDFSDLSQR